jgi:hypothetical protein
MRKYFILEGQEETGPYTIDILQGKKLSSNTLIREEDSYSWTTAGQIEELAGHLSIPNKILKRTVVQTIEPPKVQVRHLNQPKRPKAHINEKIIPVAIVFAIGSIIVSMDWAIETKSTQIMNHPIMAKPVVSVKDSVKEVPQVEAIAEAAKTEKPKEVKTVIIKEPTIEKQPVIEDATADRAAYFKENWTRFITVANSNYNHGLLGGIKGLSIIFKNETDYPIEEIVARITYIKANGKPWLVKTIPVYNLAAHGEKLQSVAKVSRGKSVRISIEKITSSKMKFYYQNTAVENLETNNSK